uniref:Uncharacterized protein n=1 Tax=Oryza glumipatula TaxID=40148 RepID=A0A0D9YKA5_9ORYZ
MLAESHLDLPRSDSGSGSCIRVQNLVPKLHLDVPSSRTRTFGPREVENQRSSNSIRTFGPREVENQFHIYRLKDEIEAVIANIEKMCRSVQLEKGFLEKGGFCFGLVNPMANIIINSAISQQVCPAADRGSHISPRAGGGRRRKRGEEKALDPNLLRSLDSLTAFLTCIFPYLPDAEARLYLDAVDADPFVASLLIINRRQLREFDFYSQTTQAAVEVALRCAAVAAKHPDPQGLVLGWKCLAHSVDGWRRLSHAVEKFSSVPSSENQRSLFMLVQAVLKDHWTSDPVLRLEQTWELARSRLMRQSSTIYARPKVLPPTRAHMKRMLLSTIHGFYVQAMGRLPTFELCNSFHCSMLKGGYCYARSLYGLVSFLCTRYGGLKPDLAMQRLLVTGVNLKAADPSPHDIVRSTLTASVPEAYTAAATAALHNYPTAQKEFFTSRNGMTKLECVSKVLRSQDGGPGSQYGVSQSASHGPLTPQNLNVLRMILQWCPSSVNWQVARKSHQQKEACKKVKKRNYAHMCQCRNRFWGQHARVTSMVRDALDKFNNTVDHPFELHIIFGVNELVSGPVPSMGEKVGDYNPWTRYKYYHTHINFLAVCKARPYDPPTLFFAECGKDGADTCWCFPVTPYKSESGQVRCIYCEYQGSRILHPTGKSFHGCNEFEKLYYVSSNNYTNDELITNKVLEVDWVHGVQDGAIYLDCRADSDDDEDDWLDIF